MEEFNNLEEIEQYFNKETNTYIFVEDGKYFDIKFDFDLDIDARNIDAGDINARNIFMLFVVVSKRPASL